MDYHRYLVGSRHHTILVSFLTVIETRWLE